MIIAKIAILITVALILIFVLYFGKQNKTVSARQRQNQGKFYNKHVVAAFIVLFLFVGVFVTYNKVKFVQPPNPRDIASIYDYLADNPEDAQAYQMLGLALSLKGETDKAINAYAKAYELGNNDLNLLIEYASILANKNGSFQGLPTKLVGIAVKNYPTSVEALYLAGVIAATNSDLILAQKIWQQALLLSDENTEEYVAISNILNEVNNTLLNDEDNIQIEIVVDIEEKLYKKFFDGFIMVYAKEVTNNIPVAIEKIALNNFNGIIVLDNNDSIMPTKKLSDVENVIIVVRLSNTGLAKKQSDDIEITTKLINVYDHQVLELKIDE